MFGDDFKMHGDDFKMHGGYLNYGDDFHNISSNGPLRGQKGTLYEGGHRVPLIVSWLGKVKPATSNTLTHSNDMLPTICSVAGVETTAARTDGVNLWPSLQARTTNAPGTDVERTLYWRAGKEWAIREGPWKLVYERGHRELFQLSNDVSEERDIAAEHPEMVERLEGKWETWNRSMPE